MKLTTSILLFLISIIGHSFGQTIVTVRGEVYDSAAQASIAGASVQWISGKGRLLSAASTNQKGVFELKINGKPGEGTLQVSCVSYRALNLPLTLEGDKFLGILYLSPQFNGLKDITVTGRKQGYRIGADKKTYEVAGNLSAGGGTMEEVFKQVPGVTINGAGKLSLRNGPPRILIDGKRTDLTLEQIPADQVQSVEIMTSPSAKYDAQGSSGMINILMKKNRKAGLNGSIQGNYTGLPEKTLSGNLNVVRGKLSIMTSYFQHAHRSRYTDELVRNTLTDHTSLRQSSSSETKGPFEQGKLAIEYKPNTRNSFGVSGDIGGGNFSTDKEQVSSFQGSAGTKTKGALRASLSKENFRFGHMALDYNHLFAKEGEKLSSSFNMEQYNAPQSGSYRMQYTLPDGQISGSPDLQRYAGGIRAHTISFQTDYSGPLRSGKAKLEVGLKLNWHHDHNRNLMEDYASITHEYIRDKNATYNFYYRDPTYAGYGNYSDKYGWFSCMAGIRFEQYNYTGSMPDSAVRFTYHNPAVFPSLFLTADLGDGKQLHLNYSRRVNRPAFDEVSPRTDYSNPQNLFRGNPDLQSEYTNLAELSYNLQKGSAIFSATFYLRNTPHLITTYTTVIAPDTLLSTYINADQSNTYGGELLYRTSVIKGWDLTANANVFETRLAVSNAGEGLNGDGISWFAKLGSDIALPRDFTLQLSGSYEAPKIIAQGKAYSTGSVDLSIKKDFLPGKKLSVILSLTDLFNTGREKQRTYMAEQFEQYYLQKYTTRTFKVSMSYSFGKSKS